MGIDEAGSSIWSTLVISFLAIITKATFNDERHFNTINCRIYFVILKQAGIISASLAAAGCEAKTTNAREINRAKRKTIGLTIKLKP